MYLSLVFILGIYWKFALGSLDEEIWEPGLEGCQNFVKVLILREAREVELKIVPRLHG